MEWTGPPEELVNTWKRPCTQRRMADSEGRRYIASGTVPKDTNRWEILVFPDLTAGNPVIVATQSEDFEVARKLLEGWLNGSGYRGDPPSILQEMSWKTDDLPEEEFEAWVSQPHVFSDLLEQLVGNLQPESPELMMGSTVGIAMMLGVDLSDAPPEIKATLMEKGLWPYDE